MRYEYKGTSISYGTPDLHAPEGDVPASASGQLIGVKLTFAVQPIGARNKVQVSYRLNGVVGRPLQAPQSRMDAHTKTQYFVATVPELHVGDKFEYIGVVSWPGGQAPAAAEASAFPSSFKVVAAGSPSTADASKPDKAASGHSAPSSSAAHSASDASADKTPPSSKQPSPTPSTLNSFESDAQLTALLAASPEITSAVRARFVSRYSANKGTLTEFWDELSKDPELGPVVPQLELLLQLGTVTLHNPELVAKLLAQFHPTSMRDLAKLDSAQLVKIITDGKIHVPAKLADKTTPSTVARYADEIISSVREAFPTDFVAKSLGASDDKTHQAVATLLSKSPDLDLSTTKIDSYLADHPDALAGRTADESAALTDRLKATQRLMRITKDGDAIQTLIKLGFDSSYKIAATPRGSFLDQHADALGGQDVAAQIYANAISISAITSHIIRQAQENAAPGTPRMIGSGHGEAGKTLDAHLPNWQTLFGASSTCQCTECRAVDGPAAYFVSLLQFLENIGRKTTHPPLDVLLDRRPDLANLKLNCANADTALPYVDLVNEILESYVAHSKLSVSTAHDTPTDATPQALQVNPEYLQTPDAIKAYETLNSSSVVYPLTLPFDRYLETIRDYLHFLGTNRYQLLKEFGTRQSGNDAASPQLAAEYLRMSEAEYVLITGDSFSGKSDLPKNVLFKYFGYSSNDHTWQKKTLIEQVPEFLSRTGVSYGEMLELLETHYLNPRHTIALQLTNANDPCDITKMRIENVEDLLSPLPAFLRLRKKLDWKISELDYALRAFGKTPGIAKADNPRPVPVDFILVAAQLKQLQKTLNLSVSEIVSLWHNIDTDGRNSHYNSLFQNKAVLNPPDPGFRLVYQAPLESMPDSLPERFDGTVHDQTFRDTPAKQLHFLGDISDHQHSKPGSLPERSSDVTVEKQTSHDTPAKQLPFLGDITDHQHSTSDSLPKRWSDGTVQNQASYDTHTKQLQFVGVMTDRQRDDLLKWAGNSEDANAAIQALYSQRWYDRIEIGGIRDSVTHSSSTAEKEKHSDTAEKERHFNTTEGERHSEGAEKEKHLNSTEGDRHSEAAEKEKHSNTTEEERHSDTAEKDKHSKPAATAVSLPADSIGNHVHTIRAGLRTSSADLVAIGQDAGYCDRQSAIWMPGTLSLGNVSMLYRYAILARSLGFSIPDLITLKNLTGLEPFNTRSKTAGPVTDAMVQFVAAAREVKASRFTIAHLAYLYGSTTGIAATVTPLQTTMDSIVSTILVGLQNITAANAYAPDPTGAALRKKLAALLPSAPQLDAIMSLIGGSTIYVAPLAALPSGVVLHQEQVSFVTAATIGGTVTAQDLLTLTVTSSAIGGSPVAVSYPIQPTDTPNMIAAALAAQINANPALVASGISAMVSGATIGLAAPPTLSPSPVWTASESPAGASESVTLGGSLFCAGPMTDATAARLTNVSRDPGFDNAIRDLYNQAQNVLIQNLGLPVYFAALPVLPARVALPPGQVSFVTAATIGGTITARDSLSLTVTSSGVTGSPVTVSYTAQATDAANTIAAALVSQIDGNPALVAAGVSAIAFGDVISLSSPPKLSPTLAWTVSVSPSTASESVHKGGGLVCYGAMPKSTKAALLSLSEDSGFTSAINFLYNQANRTVGSVIANLIRTLPASSPAVRYDDFLQKFLAYLIETQSRNLVKQSLAEALNLDAGIVQLLVDGNVELRLPRGLIPSNAEPAESAINDFLGGLSAAYYNSEAPDLAQAPKLQIDQGVNLDGTQPAFGRAEWTGKLLAPTTASYSFAVAVSSLSKASSTSQVALTIAGQTVNLGSSSGASGSANAINLTAGQLYDLNLTISGAPPSASVQLQWSMSPAPPGAFVTIPALAFMPCATDGSYPTLALLFRVATLVRGFSMKPAEIAYLSTHSTDFAGIDPRNEKAVAFSLSGLASASDLPALFNQWQRLNSLYDLKARLPAGNVTLFDIFATASSCAATVTSAASAGSVNPVVQKIMEATGWNRADLLALVGAGGFKIPEQGFRNEIPLIPLSSCLEICSRIGVPAQKLLEWAHPGSALQSIAQDLQHTAKAKYDDATWLQVGKPLNDKLRESSKDALIAHVLQMPKMRQFVDVNDLYGYFLIDVGMCTCMETSRIVQASAAVQLFVQRVLLNLENDVKPSAFTSEDIEEWNQWRKEYRVWQAAVEMLMYPENWIVPELRPNKTPFFKDLETTLLQGEVNAGNAEAAYLAYLESLQQVARLEIAGVYPDLDPEAGTELTHVIGRTFTKPHVYFYRTLDNSSYTWSPWEKVDADISGDSLIPVVWNRRLFLFWPIYTEATDTTQNTPPASSLNNQNSSFSIPQSSPPIKSLQIQLAWSEYKSGKWTPKQVTAQSLTPPGYASYSDTLDTNSFAYTAAPQGQDGLGITGYSTVYRRHEDTDVINLLITIVLGTFDKVGNPPSSSDIASVSAALQALIVTMGQLKLVHVSANTSAFVQLQSSAALFSSLMQAMNAASPPRDQTISAAYSKARNECVSACDSLTDPKPSGPITVQLGSFFFDGPQGSVEIQPETTYASSLSVGRFPAAAQHYGSSDSKTVSQFSNQDISLEKSGFSLLFSTRPSETPTAITDFAGTISKVDVSFPQQLIPGYTFDLATRTGDKVAFYADRRRTYFVVQSSSVKHSTTAAFSESVPPESMYIFNHQHAWIGEFIKRLNWKGIGGLLDPSSQALASKFDETSYGPTRDVAKPYPDEVVDFGQTMPVAPKAKHAGGQKSALVPPGDSAYAIYNWEIFFYIPFFIATCLSRNQKCADAQTWFHYIFNPTQDPERKHMPSGYERGVPNGYWNFHPLNHLSQDGGLQQLLDSVSSSGDSANAELNAQVQAWTHAPFEPDVIARLRPVAYQKAVVMRYVDNQIKWGDYLFAQNTRESIYEALQHYILADQTWGHKQVIIPELGTVQDQTYHQLAKDKINQLGNAQVQLENAFPLTVAGKVPRKGATGSSVLGTTVHTSYFCMPANPTLSGYYDTIADRLYKIRHCMNIQGQVEQLPLFAPAISPGLLAAAEAAGVDLSSVLSDIGAAVPHYRFSYMLSKALELCSEVRSLGAAMLAACEKYDAEGMALLRSGQEIAVLSAVRQIKQMQIEEAKDNLAGLQATLAVTTARQTYYQGLINAGLSGYEIAQVECLALSEEFKLVSQFTSTGAAALALIPQIDIGVNGAFGSPAVHVVIGGQQYADSADSFGKAFTALAEVFSFVATMAGMMGGWDRRASEWTFQMETATLELAQIQQQINAAQLRVQIATQDLANQELQIAHASAVHDALRSKFTNQQLYSWMVGQVSALFFQCYQMAYDLAKRAEVCYRFELGIQESSYIQFGYWDSLRKGLLAGEKLFKDLKRLENSYLDQNAREYEISKSVSLLLLDPLALISLKLTGMCVMDLPEAYFDIDYPGHYMRRVKSVSLTIPCVTGPYNSVNCTLTLLQSKIRVKADSAPSYPEKPISSDHRFSYDFAATESIASSTAQNDSGMFEINLRDERYLPFEGRGVISQWQLLMQPDCNAFDFDTIADVILNLRYTARNGGDGLRAVAKSAAVLPPRPVQPVSQSGSQSPQQANLQRGFSLRHEYPTEWYKFLQPPSAATGANPTSSMQINLSNERFPFQYRGKKINITKADLFVMLNDSSSDGLQVFSLSTPAPPNSVPKSAQLSRVTRLGNAPHFATSKPPTPSPATQGGPKCWILQYAGDLSQQPITDIFLVCGFSAD